MHFSYLIPTTIIRNPLDNTLQFTLVFNFVKGGKKNSDNSGISLIDDAPKKKAKDNNTNDNNTPQPQQPAPDQPANGQPASPK